MTDEISKIKKLSDKHLTGEEEFSFNGKATGMTMLEFWRWHYSEIFDLQEKIAEFIVARALGLNEADNVGSWTLYDIDYRNTRIEIKETSYVHAWQTDEEEKSERRSFGITKAHSKYGDSSSELARQNDIYVFCLNTGMTRAESNPLQLEHWEFYIVPTEVINEECGDGKSISLSRVRKMTNAVDYSQIKSVIDEIIDIKIGE